MVYSSHLFFRPVYAWNHDCLYNDALPIDEGIRHVYVKKFEHVEENVEDLLSKYGRTFGHSDTHVFAPFDFPDFSQLFSTHVQQLTLSSGDHLVPTSAE